MKKILIIESNLHLHDILRKMFRLMGYGSITAASGKEGLQKAISKRPDLILLSIGLSDMDGRNAARQLRSDSPTKDIPILAVTSMFDLSLGKTCLEAGCDDYIVKPIAHQLLEGKVQALLGEAIL